jgi:hypothetical protein
MCVEGNCTEFEFLEDYSCFPLDCEPYQAFVNHSCLNLTCEKRYGILNHSCQSLDVCADNELIINYSCTPLVCKFMKKPENHECVFNSTLLLHLLLLIGIVVFFAVDYGFFRKKRHRKHADELLKQKHKNK